MKTNIDYGVSQSPQFDAVEDIKEYLGDRYDTIANYVKHLGQNEFEIVCGLAGIEGFPVKAWFNHFNGFGAWKSPLLTIEH